MPEYLKAYCLTGMSRKERLQAIIQSIDKFHYQFRGIHMVVIDGIADLIKGTNDVTGNTVRWRQCQGKAGNRTKAHATEVEYSL